MAALLIAQISLVELLTLKGCRPDLILIFLLFYAAGKGRYQPILIGFALGLIQDLAGGGFLGLNALSKSVAGFFIAKLIPKKVPEVRWMYICGGIICILAHDLVHFYIFGQHEYHGFFNFVWRQVLPVSAYNTVIYIIISLLPSRRKMID